MKIAFVFLCVASAVLGKKSLFVNEHGSRRSLSAAEAPQTDDNADVVVDGPQAGGEEDDRDVDPHTGERGGNRNIAEEGEDIPVRDDWPTDEMECQVRLGDEEWAKRTVSLDNAVLKITSEPDEGMGAKYESVIVLDANVVLRYKFRDWDARTASHCVQVFHSGDDSQKIQGPFEACFEDVEKATEFNKKVLATVVILRQDKEELNDRFSEMWSHRKNVYFLQSPPRYAWLSEGSVPEESVDHLKKMSKWFKNPTKADGTPVPTDFYVASSPLTRGIWTAIYACAGIRLQDSGQEMIKPFPLHIHLNAGEVQAAQLDRLSQAGLVWDKTAHDEYILAGFPEAESWKQTLATEFVYSSGNAPNINNNGKPSVDTFLREVLVMAGDKDVLVAGHEGWMRQLVQLEGADVNVKTYQARGQGSVVKFSFQVSSRGRVRINGKPELLYPLHLR